MDTVTETTGVGKLVVFGMSGDTVYLAKGHTISGHGSPERPHAGDGKRPFLRNGCPVIDLRPAIATTAGFKHVTHGPMVDVDLLVDVIDRCPEPEPLFAAAVAGNPYGTLLALQAASKAKAGPLDCVCISEYLAGWRALGARIGSYRDGAIVWDAEIAGAE